MIISGKKYLKGILLPKTIKKYKKALLLKKSIILLNKRSEVLYHLPP